MNHSPLYPELRIQLDSVLPLDGIDAIDKICHDFTITNQSKVSGIHQPAGTALLFYLETCHDGSQLGILPFLVPLTMSTAKIMNADSTQDKNDFQKALDQEDFYLLGCQLLGQTLAKGASMQQFVDRRNQLIQEELVDAVLIIKTGDSERFYLLEIYVGERLLEQE
jgi:hypothetical protein